MTASADGTPFSNTDDSQPKDRQIRVFVSSTFLDMKADRDYLVKFIFPQLRKLCDSRGVVFTDVDLRWGITEEEAAEGRVLPICLAEIERCRPFFIGLLGQRYGWVPKSIPQELLDKEPWLAEHKKKSVTELEILHGVLNNPAMSNRACFYFRDPSSTVDADFDTESGHAEKLAALKERIRDSDVAWHDNYPDAQTLGEWIREDLTRVINQEFPPGSQPSALERQAAEHESFSRSRTVRQVGERQVGCYIGRQEYFERLDAQAAGDGLPLVVLGSSGSGKSALLANWAERYRQSHPAEQVLLHFVGATADSADWSAMLRRILGELKQRFEIELEIPDNADELRTAFANSLHMVAARSRLVLVIDALNQLEDREGAPDLVWLPPGISENVRLIISTLPGRPLADLEKRDWPTLEVEPLSAVERSQFVRDYLWQYTKTLSDDQVEKIAGCDQAANPLFLRSLLEELRVFGSYEELDERIDYYLEAQTIPDLYEKILIRWEKDYEGDSDLVGDAFSLLWASRHGLSEAELLEMLGTGDLPLPRAMWSPLFLAAESSLSNQSGLLNFSNDYLRDAIRDTYIPTEHHQRDTHLRLANYFRDCNIDSRSVVEFPWQLCEAAEWQQLFDLLADLPLFEFLWKAVPFDLKVYWSHIEAASPLRMVDAYQSVLDDPIHYQKWNWEIAELFYETGHLNEAYQLWEHLVEHYRKTGEHNNLGSSLGHQALILQARGDLEEAMKLYKQEEEIYRDLGLKNGLANSFTNQANILQKRGDLDGAIKLHKQAEQIYHELGNKLGLAASLNDQTATLRARGDMDGAMNLCKQAEIIFREWGHKNGLANSIANQANIFLDHGDLEEAMKLYKQAEQIHRELGNKANLSLVINNQGNIFLDRGDLEEAMDLYKQAEQIYRELDIKEGLSKSLAGQANILFFQGDLDGAMNLYKQVEIILRETGIKGDLPICLNNQANLLRGEGDLEEAMELYKQAENICHDLGYKDELSNSLTGQAQILKSSGDLDGAIELHKQSEKIHRNLGNEAELSKSLICRAMILKFRGDLEEAMDLYKQAEQIYRELEDKDELSRTLVYQALILECCDDLEGAMNLHKQAENICRESGNKFELSMSLGCQADNLRFRNDLDGAMDLYKQAEKICRELGKKYELSMSLSYQADILRVRGDLDGAMDLYEQAEQIYRELGDKDELSRTLVCQALILECCDDLEGAMNLHKQAENICRESGHKNMPLHINDLFSDQKTQMGGRPRPNRYSDADQETELNIRYQNKIAMWNAMPFWRRLYTPKPNHLKGI